MSSRLRYKSQQQADREIRKSQSGFLGGVNIDLPRSEINETQLCNADNIISYRTHTETRPGTERIGAMPGVGTAHNLYFHQSRGQYILHRQDRVYVSTDLITWNESVNVTDLADSASTMRAYKEDLIIFQDEKITYLELSNPNDLVLRRLNASNPVGALNVINKTNPSSSGPYGYNFVYTYYREVDGVIVAESGAAVTEIDGQEVAVRTVYYDTPIEENLSVVEGFIAPTDADSLQNVVSPGIGSMDVGGTFQVSKAGNDPTFSTQWTGIRIYRSGEWVSDTNAGLPFTFNLVGTYTFEQANNWSAGLGYMDIGGSFQVGYYENNIGIDDSDLYKRESFTSYGYTPIPNGLVGEVTPGFIFSAQDESSTYYYSEVGAKVIRAGYYFAGGQFQELDGSIKGLFRSPDSLIILCKNQTYRVSVLNSSSNNIDVIAFTALYPATIMDENTGVTDIGSVSFMDRSRFIALCSDYTVRVFDGVNWGYDRAKQLVSDEIRKAAIGSVSVYHPDGYYILWYKDDASLEKPNKTLRLGLTEDVGIGWSPYSGDAWVSPPSRAGVIRGIDDTTSLMMIVGVDTNTDSITQIETFDGPSNSRFVRRDVDDYNGVPTNFEWSMDFGELIGSTESFWVLHENTNFFLRPFYRDGEYPDGLVVTVECFVDDESTASATFKTEDLKGDISFDKNLNGKRIRLRLSGSRPGVKLVGTETVYRVQDRPTRSQSNYMANYQLELATDLVLWGTRLNPLDNVMKLPGSVSRSSVVVGNIELIQDQLQSGNYTISFDGNVY